MDRKQWYQFLGWVAFSVILPVLVYPAAWLLAFLTDTNFSWTKALSSGELLFLVVVQLAMTVNWMIQDFRERPQKSTKQSLSKDVYDYCCFIGVLLSLIIYTMIYGWVITNRIPGGIPVSRSEAMMWFCICSLIGYASCCGMIYYRILKDGRI